jgi:hypothetical protein
LLKKGLYEENLDSMSGCCTALALDSSHTLPFFVLRAVFREIASLLASGAITASAHSDLVNELSPLIDRLLGRLAENQEVTLAELDAIVCTHLRNAGVFRSTNP